MKKAKTKVDTTKDMFQYLMNHFYGLTIQTHGPNSIMIQCSGKPQVWGDSLDDALQKTIAQSTREHWPPGNMSYPPGVIMNKKGDWVQAVYCTTCWGFTVRHKPDCMYEDEV